MSDQTENPSAWDFAETASGEYPPALTEYDQWMCRTTDKLAFAPWADDTSDADSPDSRFSWSKPENWGDFEQAMGSTVDPRVTDDLAFISQKPDDPYDAPPDPFLMVDFDNVRDPETGEVIPEATSIIAALGATYVDVSTSGGGLHADYIGELPEDFQTLTFNLRDDAVFGHSKAPEVEVYDGKRLFICTGDRVRDAFEDVAEVDADALAALCEQEGKPKHRARKPDAETDERPEPRRSREQLETIETTNDVQDVYDAVDQLDFADLPVQTTRNETQVRADGTQDLDPAYRTSESGTGAFLSDDGELVIDRDGMTAMTPIQLFAVEEGIIRRGEELRGEDFREAVDRARDAGAPIPEYDPNADADAIPEPDQAPDDADESDEDEEVPTAPDDPYEIEWRDVRGFYESDDIENRDARNLLVQLLRHQHDWAAMTDTEELYHYDDAKGIYEDGGEQFVGALLEEHIPRFHTETTHREVVHRLKQGNWTDRDEFGGDEDNPMVCVRNGVVDIETDELHDHDPGLKFVRRIPVEYDPDADCPEFDAFLDDVVEKDAAKRLVYELLGHAIHPGYPVAGFAMFYGDGANGKSTLLDWMQEFLAPENVSNETLQQLAESRFSTASLYGKMANIGADLPASELESTGTLKTLTGGDYVRAEKKHRPVFAFKNEATLIFAANEPPATPDETTAFWRRLLLLNFPNEFTPKGEPGPDRVPKRELFDRIATDEEKSGALNRAIEAAQRLRASGEFSQTISKENRADQYKKLTDPVYAFASECVDEDDTEFIPFDRLKAVYAEWCRENDAPQKESSVLARELATHLRFDKSRKRVDGRRQNCYVGISLTSRGQELLEDPDERDERTGGQTGLNV